MARTSSSSSCRRDRHWRTPAPLVDGVRNAIGFFDVSAVNAAVFAGILEFSHWYIGTSDETESVEAPGLDALSMTATQLLYLQFAALFRRTALFVPPLAAVLVHKAASLSVRERRRVTTCISALLALLLLLALAFPVAIIAAYRDTNEYTRRIEAHEPQTMMAFNSYYCSARGTLWCANPDERELATLVKRFNGASEHTDRSEAILRVFRSCQHLLIANRGGLSTRQAQFLATVNTSDAVDAWCGRAIAQHALEGASHTTLLDGIDGAAPVSINLAKLEHFASVWSAQLMLDALVLALVALLVLVLVYSWLGIPDTYELLEPAALQYALADDPHADESHALAAPVSASGALESKGLGAKAK